MTVISHLDIKAANGVPFRVLYIPPGEPSPNFPGAVEAQHRKEDGTVEFYDARYPHTPDGQSTGGRYYLSTLLALPEGKGLDLHGGVSAWTLDATTFELVSTWLRRIS